jgi:hypothetical protein
MLPLKKKQIGTGKTRNLKNPAGTCNLGGAHVCRRSRSKKDQQTMQQVYVVKSKKKLFPLLYDHQRHTI